MAEDDSGLDRALSVVAEAGKAAGRATVKAARAIGRGAASTYESIDPDLRKHFAEAPLLGLTLLSPGEKADEDLPDDGHRPIVWVHGLGGSPKNFLLMRTYFRLHGRRRSKAFDIGEGSIEEASRALGAFIVALAERTNAASVDVVAHSMGGVVTRIALEDEVVRARVATLVTLGTPHTGTHLARLASTSRTLDLRPGSPLVERLARQVPWKAPPRLVALYSENDTVILPASSASVEGAENVDCAGTTHTGYLLEVGVFRRVLDALEPRGDGG